MKIHHFLTLFEHGVHESLKVTYMRLKDEEVNLPDDETQLKRP